MKQRLRLISKYAAIGLGITIAFIFLVGLQFRFKNRGEPLQLGVSYSLKQVDNFGLDRQETLRKLTEEANFKHLRLMSYWDLHEQAQNEYDFSELDWQFEQAKRTGATVTLALGQRQPRWPECHIPTWAYALDKPQYQQELLEYIERVVLRYREHSSLVSYQLENEAINRLFGECPAFERGFYQQEFELVQQLDSDAELITNVSNQSGFQFRKPVGDAVGFSLYKTANFVLGDTNIQWHYWYVPSWWHGFRASMIEILYNSKVFVHELQAEPWGPQDIWEMPDQQQTNSMPLATVEDQIIDARQSGMSTIYLWGGEWFVWREQAYDDSRYMDYFRNLN